MSDVDFDSEEFKLDYIAGVLSHARYLTGCAAGVGDFDDEPAPTRVEWEKICEALEEAMSEFEKVQETLSKPQDK